MTRPEASSFAGSFAGGWLLPTVGGGLAAFAAAAASSSGRGRRLSKAGPTRLALGPLADPNSGVETAALEPWSETPRTLAVLSVGVGRLFAPEPADHAEGDVGAEEEGVLRRSGIFDVKPGGGAAAPGRGVAAPDGGVAIPAGGGAVPEGGVAIPAGGVAVPDGCHAGGSDDGDDE